MATNITINLDDAREAELVKLTAEANAVVVDPSERVTSAQFLRREVRARLDLSAAQRDDSERLRLRQLYNSATPEEQASIDAILLKYRT